MEFANFFEQMNHKLDEIHESHISNEEYQEEYSLWKNKLIPKLKGTYKIKVSRLSILSFESYPILKTILRDMYFQYNPNKDKSKSNIESEKLLKVREKSIDFELNLANMITGDNTVFPYRTSTQLTKFFQDLGYDFTHNSTTRNTWVKDRLLELNILEIHMLISQGLFKKKCFVEHAQKSNDKMLGELQQHPDFHSFLTTADECLNEATKTFKLFIKEAMQEDIMFDLSTVLDMNINVELLFDNNAMTSDSDLNNLIEEAKERFMSNDKQVGIEKLWAAYERLKTYFSDIDKNGKDKKESLKKVIQTISKDFSTDFLDKEFQSLTKIGNNYRIRHHEKNKLDLTDIHRNYFFFRMLSLIDLCLVYLNEENL